MLFNVSKSLDEQKFKNCTLLQVKDKYITIQARTLATDLKITGFSGSPGWLQNFKVRHNLVSRRQTSIRQLPVNADTVAVNFISEVREFAAEHNIKLSNILNMDQVPRYYEGTAESTITDKGAKKVLLRKGGTSHKRFTATFTISADGKMLKPHVLLSKITRTPPNMNNNVMLALNQTGMWSSEILDDYVKEIILKRPASSMLREPVLLLMDSYGPHVKLANSKKYEKHKVYIKLIPPNLTPLLQPLDVAVNKSFQTTYNDLYNKYIETAITSESLQTKSGRPKVPSHGVISDWVLKWASEFAAESIRKAFICCGIGVGAFQPEDLHHPLRELYDKHFNQSDWLQNNELMAAPDNVEPNFLDLFIPDEQDGSFYKCVHYKLKVGIDFKTWFTDYIKEIINIIKAEFYGDIMDTSDIELISKGEVVSEVEIVAFSSKEDLKVIIHVLDTESNDTDQIIYGPDKMNTIHFYMYDNHYSCEL